MKKFIIFLFIFALNLSSFADDVGLLSYSSNEYSDGDIVKLKIIDARGKKHFEKYKNKRIGKLIYVIDVISQGDEVVFEAMLSQMGKKEKLPKLQDNFIIKGLNYKPGRPNQLMDFITLDIPINIPVKMSFYYTLIILILLVTFTIYWFKTKYKRRRNKKLKQIKLQNIQKLKSLFEQVESEETISTIYLKRKQIVTFFDVDENNFNEIMRVINEIQYEPKWPEDKYKRVCSQLKKIANDLQVKRGI